MTDTYRRCFSTELPVRDADGRALIGVYKIWRYKRRTRLLRKQHGLPELFDPDDLPDPIYDPNYVHVLIEEEQADLHYREHSNPIRRFFFSLPEPAAPPPEQQKFMKSQTWYRPHGTETHRVRLFSVPHVAFAAIQLMPPPSCRLSL